MTIEDFIKKAKKVHGDKYDYSKVVYKNSKEKIIIICPIHGEFYQRPSNHLEGRGCHACGGFLKRTTEEFVQKATKVHGNKYNYSKVDYKGVLEKIIIICPIHGEFEQFPFHHLSGSGCPICGLQKTTTEEFIQKATKVHGDKYNYSKVEYSGNLEKITIICPIHGEFEQSSNNHLRGHGCPSCSENKKLTTEEFIEKAKKVHENKYDYSKSIYNGARKNIKIICPEHGEFEQIAYTHLKGARCPVCMGNQLKTTKQFIDEANEKYNNKYDYSKVEYVKAHSKVNIICPKHGEFEQTANVHLRKVVSIGCPMCASEQSVSNMEKEIVDFLKKELNINNIKINKRNIIKPKELDIFLPDFNIAIEFDGLYYHSELFQKNKNYHLDKTKMCEEKNIRLIHIFEDEWIYKMEIVKSRLRNILNKTEDKIYARKCIIKEIDIYQAKEFFNKNHLQGYTNSKYKIGLFYNNELVSCMLFNNPRVGIGTNYSGYELTRFANEININVIGAANKLLKYFEKKYKPQIIKSYADKRWSMGKLYDVLNFNQISLNQPNYWYVINQKRKHRFNFRKEILKKQGFDTKNKTEHQIMLERKIYRIYDCGTITYQKVYF